MKDIRVAAAITSSPIGNIQTNLKNMATWVDAAIKKHASIVCFPEMNITGYNSGIHVKDIAQPVPGRVTEEICHMASQSDITILSGIAEKDADGNIYASHLVAVPGEQIQIYRKIHIAPPERKVFSPGNTASLFHYQGVTFGIQLCYDAHFPELSTRMALDGVDIIFMPHASPRKTPEEKLDSWLRHLTARAYDNSIFIIACNQVGSNGIGLHFPGLAVAIDPAGQIIDTYSSEQEGMMLIDLKADTLESVRNHRMKFFLPNRRPDIYGSD